jgi:hypothetical protein
VVEWLLCKPEAPSSNPSPTKKKKNPLKKISKGKCRLSFLYFFYYNITELILPQEKKKEFQILGE